MTNWQYDSILDICFSKLTLHGWRLQNHFIFLFHIKAMSRPPTPPSIDLRPNSKWERSPVTAVFRVVIYDLITERFCWLPLALSSLNHSLHTTSLFCHACFRRARVHVPALKRIPSIFSTWTLFYRVFVPKVTNGDNAADSGREMNCKANREASVWRYVH